MNKIYKSIWSKIKERWILVSEKVAASGCPSGVVGAITLAVFLSCSTTAFALDPDALPTGGKITAGTGSIAATGRQMTVNQSSEKMVANWETFNIGKKAGVAFKQPDADSTALNRISDQNPSKILGTLSANGKIFLINPSGIVFGKGAQVNVGGLVASSLDILDKDFLAGKYKFYKAGDAGDAGKIINQGDIKTESGGVVALIAPKVINDGTITAEKGSVVLAAGNQVSLDFKGDGLISYTVDQGAVDALAQNKGLIKADGGLVVMTAKAADSLTGAVVNQSGVIEAQTLQNQEGRILLLSDMENGQTIVSGKLDASAPNGGNGGYIETSAYDIKFNDTAIITTKSSQGLDGTWLIDPTDFIVGTEISGLALSTNLNNGNVIIQTSPAGAGNGDIFVNQNVSWNTDNTLTMEAYRHINVNANITAKGGAAGLVITPNTGGGGGRYFLNNGAVITLSGIAPHLTIDGHAYTVINSANGGIVTLQDINNNLFGYYALGSDISASATSAWNTGAGFVPIGNETTAFTGQFDGLGHNITSLTINRPAEDNVGLFGWNNGIVMNVDLVKGKIIGADNVGALVGFNHGIVDNATSTTPVIGGSVVGGLVGFNAGGQVTNSYAMGSVAGVSANGTGVPVALDVDNDGNNDITGIINSGNIVGGLIGLNAVGQVTNSYASGGVTGGSILGGLVGLNEGGQITNSAASGKVTGISGVGDAAYTVNMDIAADLNLDGFNDVTGNVSGSGTVSGGTIVGGLVGFNNGGTVNETAASGTVSGGSILGGLVGLNEGGQVTNSSALGSVTGKSGVGDVTFDMNANFNALVIYSEDESFAGSIYGLSNISGTGTISGGSIVGGLVGLNAGGTVDATVASGSVTGGSILGGLVGLNLDIPFDAVPSGQITNSSASGNVVGKKDRGDVAVSMNVNLDGVVGFSADMNSDGSNDVTVGVDGVSSISGSGSIKGGNILGGLVGLNAGGTINAASASGNVTGGNILGGLVGLNLDIPFDDVIGGTINDSSASGVVTGKRRLGDMTASVNVNLDGVIGFSADINSDGSNDMTVGVDGVSSIAGSGSIKGGNILGGLVGLNAGGTINAATASGNVTGGNILGGLVGLNLDIPFDDVIGGTITNSSASGVVTGKRRLGDMAVSMNVDLDGVIGLSADTNADGSNDLAGSVDGVSSISGSGSIKGGNILGGLVGLNAGGTINATSASGNVTGGNILGGLVGLNLDIPFDEFPGGTIMNSSASGVVTGKRRLGDMAASVNVNLDGVIGFSADTNFDGSNDVTVAVDGVSSISGSGSIKGGNIAGGLVGLNAGGMIIGTSASGSVTGGNILGGLVGLNLDIPFDELPGGTIMNSSASGVVTGTRGAGNMTVSANAYFDADVLFDDFNHVTGNMSGSGSIKGGNIAGGLVGLNAGGMIDGSIASGNVSGGNILGGLVGLNFDIPFDESTGGQITDSYAIGNSVTGIRGAGDMAFSANANFDVDLNLNDYEYATSSLDGLCSISGKGSIKGGNIVGGLVGLNVDGKIDGAIASANVSGGNILGGLVGLNFDIPFDESTGGQITNSAASGSVTGASGTGDMAFSMNANLNGAFDYSIDANSDGNTDFTGSLDGLCSISGKGSIKGGNIVGGLVGLNAGGMIDGSGASGNVSGGNILGGLVGLNFDMPFDESTGGQITDSSASGGVTGTIGTGDMALSMNANINGAVAYSMDTDFDGIIDNANSINLTGINSLAKFNVKGNVKGGNIIGGLVGLNAGGTIDGSNASGNVSGWSILGSLVGLDYDGQITNSLATGIVTGNYYDNVISFKEYITVLGFTIFENGMYIDGGDYVGGMVGLDYIL